MSRHARVAEGPRRSFSLTISLRSGHGFDARVVGLQDVKDILHRYMTARAASGHPFLTGHVSETTLLYASEDNGTACKGEKPAAVFAGEVHSLNDVAVECHLDELACMLIDALGQPRVYIAFHDKQWIIE